MRAKHVKIEAPEGSPTQGLRRYLYFTAAVTGAAIMIIEILGAKMLAPNFGASHYVWTAQIAVTLVALAAGYYAGGRLVDHSPKLNRLYGVVLLAAVYLSATVLMAAQVSFWCVDFNLAIGSLLASTFLFFIPLAFLAMVGPFLVRMLTSSVASVGGKVGLLTAVSTLGSFAGTLLIGYLLIPLLPNSATMYLTAGCLMLVASGYFLVWGRKGAPGVLILLLLGACLLLGLCGVVDDLRTNVPGMLTIFRKNSNFGQLLVIDQPHGSFRYYLNDLLLQNGYDKRTRQSTESFCYLLRGLARSYTPKLEDVLCIGLAAGIVPRELLHDGAKVDVVEINPAAVRVAKEFFACPTEELNLTIADGRQFINRCGKKYDAVILDAFLGDSMPSHLMTREAFIAMRNLLKADGVLVINTFGNFDPGRDFLTASLHKTLKQVFRSVRIHSGGEGSAFYVASDQPALTLYHRFNPSEAHPFCRDKVAAAFAGTPESDPQSGVVLTDDYNPVEYYDAANREKLRRRLALAVRK